MLTDEQIVDLRKSTGPAKGYTHWADTIGFARAIEAAATEPLLQRIEELERQLEKEKQYVKEMTKSRDYWMTVAAERALLLDENRKINKPLSNYEFDEIG